MTRKPTLYVLSEAPGDARHSIGRVLVPLAAHWKLLVLAAICGALLAGGLGLALPKRYRSTASLLPIQHTDQPGIEADKGVSLLASLPLLGKIADRRSRELLSVLRSRSLKLALAQEFDLAPALYRGPLARLRLALLYGRQTTPTPALAVQDGRMDKVYTAFSDDSSPLLHLSFVSRDPRQCAAVVASAIDRLAAFVARNHAADAARERDFWNLRVAEAAAELRRLESSPVLGAGSLGELQRETMAAIQSHARLKALAAVAAARAEREALGFKVIDPPQVPAAPVGPRWWLGAVFGAAAAMSLAAGGVLLAAAKGRRRPSEP